MPVAGWAKPSEPAGLLPLPSLLLDGWGIHKHTHRVQLRFQLVAPPPLSALHSFGYPAAQDGASALTNAFNMMQKAWV